MIRSDKLQEFFEGYDPVKLDDFLYMIFGGIYVKTYSDCGLYIWFGDRSTANFNDDIIFANAERNAPACRIKQPNQPKGLMSGNDALHIYTFIGYTEDEVIHKFTKYQKIKAFL
jgi:hypothetical protein